MNRFPHALLLLFLALPLLAAGAEKSSERPLERPSGDTLRIGDFSSENADGGLPEGWEVMTLRDRDQRTQYALVRALVEDDSTTVVRAVSDDAAAGLIARRRIDLKQYPVVEWRWKVEGVLENGDASQKDGDDYPARLYITFDYDEDKLGFGDKIKYRALQVMGYDDIPLRGLNYLWASKASVGKIISSPYTDWVMMLPTQSGPAQAGTWVRNRRNVLRDYRRAFEEDPPPVSGVALMTDTDDTGEKAVAYYGDIVFRKERR